MIHVFKTHKCVRRIYYTHCGNNIKSPFICNISKVAAPRKDATVGDADGCASPWSQGSHGWTNNTFIRNTWGRTFLRELRIRDQKAVIINMINTSKELHSLSLLLWYILSTNQHTNSTFMTVTVTVKGDPVRVRGLYTVSQAGGPRWQVLLWRLRHLYTLREIFVQRLQKKRKVDIYLRNI